MKKTGIVLCLVMVWGLGVRVFGAEVTFELLVHGDNVQKLPQPSAQVGVSGDHLLHTSDDTTGSTYNPGGCLSFNFQNPVGVMDPDYPAGYAEGIHSMSGSFVLDVDLAGGGALSVESLALSGYVAPNKPIAGQRLVQAGDTAANGSYGAIDGIGNSGSYNASAGGNWAFNATFDWYYDTPFGGVGTIDMTFDDYAWSGFIIPVSELTAGGLAGTVLDDSLGFYDGDFEAWLLSTVVGQLPDDAGYVLFAQGESHPCWTHSMMGMTTDGIVGESIVAYAVPEPGTFALIILGMIGVRRRCSHFV